MTFLGRYDSDSEPDSDSESDSVCIQSAVLGIPSGNCFFFLKYITYQLLYGKWWVTLQIQAYPSLALVCTVCFTLMSNH